MEAKRARRWSGLKKRGATRKVSKAADDAEKKAAAAKVVQTALGWEARCTLLGSAKLVSEEERDIFWSNVKAKISGFEAASVMASGVLGRSGKSGQLRTTSLSCHRRGYSFRSSLVTRHPLRREPRRPQEQDGIICVGGLCIWAHHFSCLSGQGRRRRRQQVKSERTRRWLLIRTSTCRWNRH